MNFIQRFKTAWKLSKGLRYVAESDADDFWTDEDGRNTKLFFESGSGKKLGIRLTNFAIKMALDAVQDSTGSKNGDARGVTACIGAIELHFPKPEEPSTPAHEVQMPEMEILEA